MYYRKCLDCNKIIYLSFDTCEHKCFECKVKEDEKCQELERYDYKCPKCDHEWVEYPHLEPK